MAENEPVPGCPHGMPKRNTCIDCMNEGPVSAPTKWLGVGVPFTARFDAECPSCEWPITAGRVLVQRWDFGDQRTIYTHRECRPTHA